MRAGTIENAFDYLGGRADTTLGGETNKREEEKFFYIHKRIQREKKEGLWDTNKTHVHLKAKKPQKVCPTHKGMTCTPTSLAGRKKRDGTSQGST